jgi:hypothetical protein
MSKTKRDLSAILEDIDSVLRSDTANVIRIGNLLIEAKKQVKHGEWLPLLKKRFDFPESTARNYMKAAKYAASKSATVADLKIAPALLYALASGDQTFLEVEDRILKAAETERVDMDRAFEIHRAWVLERPEPEPDPNRWLELTADEAAAREAEAARLQVERARLEAEARAKARREAAAQAAQAEPEPEPERTVITKAELMAIIAQIPGMDDPNEWEPGDPPMPVIEIIGSDLELYDAFLKAAEAFNSLAYRISDESTVSEHLNARYEAEEAEKKAATARLRAQRKKWRAEQAAAVPA